MSAAALGYRDTLLGLHGDGAIGCGGSLYVFQHDIAYIGDCTAHVEREVVELELVFSVCLLVGGDSGLLRGNGATIDGYGQLARVVIGQCAKRTDGCHDKGENFLHNYLLFN